ncbi:carbohydrate kinase family protein [Pseudohoeflea coraliihabitans]|uniref:Carbohydrate kinase family protein n=1 Tax=Pseudohoeflea coraliihabitans TaxID=2860393 RepID=A0ABS6WQ97_9HYPH|nr:PfkB family carbohydrate kinase [Pseudohoeflea sp. DP4N28-3]MBW3097557.1 carbohydrate kinase family protein [Pseudohoeflea sp. DP4N28-3]
MAEPALLVTGNVNVDLVLGEIDGWPQIGTEIEVDRAETRAGGSAGNTALALCGLGVPHRLISSVGTDSYGDWLKAAFDDAMCDWIKDPGATTVTVGIVHKGGDRAFFTTPGHLQTMRAGDVIARLPAAPHARSMALISGGFLMPDIIEGSDRLIGAMKQRGWRVAIDPGWPPAGWTETMRAKMLGWLGQCDMALINEDELHGLLQATPTTGGGLDALVARLPAGPLHVIKQGAEGASVWREGRRVASARSPEVSVIDTVGAGDTFNAALLARLTENDDLAVALEAGVQTAARAITSYPRRYR